MRHSFISFGYPLYEHPNCTLYMVHKKYKTKAQLKFNFSCLITNTNKIYLSTVTKQKLSLTSYDKKATKKGAAYNAKWYFSESIF